MDHSILIMSSDILKFDVELHCHMTLKYSSLDLDMKKYITIAHTTYFLTV